MQASLSNIRFGGLYNIRGLQDTHVIVRLQALFFFYEKFINGINCVCYIVAAFSADLPDTSLLFDDESLSSYL